MTTLATVRDQLVAVLSTVNGQTYRGKRTNYEYPAFVISPQSMDARPAMGTSRDFLVDVLVGVEITDEDGSEDLLDDLAHEVLDLLLAEQTWDVQTVEAFDAVANDSRVIGWWRIELAVFE